MSLSCQHLILVGKTSAELHFLQLQNDTASENNTFFFFFLFKRHQSPWNKCSVYLAGLLRSKIINLFSQVLVAIFIARQLQSSFASSRTMTTSISGSFVEVLLKAPWRDFTKLLADLIVPIKFTNDVSSSSFSFLFFFFCWTLPEDFGRIPTGEINITLPETFHIFHFHIPIII